MNKLEAYLARTFGFMAGMFVLWFFRGYLEHPNWEPVGNILCACIIVLTFCIFTPKD